jgi:hypothetical protein
MGKLDTVEVNGPEGDVVDWDAVDWRAVEDDVRRLRHRIFTEGLLEPGASKRRTPGSEGAAAQQCAAATRLSNTSPVMGVAGSGASGSTARQLFVGVGAALLVFMIGHLVGVRAGV